MCQPEVYNSQEGKLMGVVMRKLLIPSLLVKTHTIALTGQVNQCEANNLPVSVDMTKIPGYPYVAPQAEASDLPANEVSASTQRDDTTTSDIPRTTDESTTLRNTTTTIPVTTSRKVEVTTPSLADEETIDEPLLSSSGFKLQGHHTMAIGFGFMLASIFF
jgi:hypothetical protein